MNESTRERLILAARRIFADKGYHAASVRAITKAAGANLGAITYHFGSKQGLYEAVLEVVLEPMSVLAERGAPVRPGAGDDGPLDRIEAIVASLFEHLAANPDLQLLILQHVAVRRSLPEPLQRRLGPLLERLATEVRAGQAAGSIRASDPLLTAVSVMAQPMYFGLVTRFAPGRLTSGRGAAPGAATLSEHARGFIRAGLASGLATGLEGKR